MNKMLRRKKRPAPYQPKKRKPSKRPKRVWNGEASSADLYYAGIDPRQLHFFFYPATGTHDQASGYLRETAE